MSAHPFAVRIAARPTAALAAGVAALVVAWPAAASAAGSATGEATPLDLGTRTVTTGSSGDGGSGILRVVIGLALVVALIYGVRWALRRVQAGRTGRTAGSGMRPVASLPLGPRGTLHLVRVGDDVILLGQADGQLAALRSYGREEAERLGMLAAPAVAVLDGDPARPEQPSGGDGLRLMLDGLRARTVRR